MSPVFWLEGVLIGGGVLLFAAWELWSLRREERKDKDKDPPGA